MGQKYLSTKFYWKILFMNCQKCPRKKVFYNKTFYWAIFDPLNFFIVFMGTWCLFPVNKIFLTFSQFFKIFVLCFNLIIRENKRHISINTIKNFGGSNVLQYKVLCEEKFFWVLYNWNCIKFWNYSQKICLFQCLQQYNS